MDKNLLKHFLKNDFFKKNIKVLTCTQNNSYGRTSATYSLPVDKKVVLMQATAGQLQQSGFGKLIDNQTFFMFCDFEIGMNDKILYEKEYYQRQNSEDWKDWGFNKYIISIYNQDNLNKETIEEEII